MSQNCVMSLLFPWFKTVYFNGIYQGYESHPPQQKKIKEEIPIAGMAFCLHRGSSAVLVSSCCPHTAALLACRCSPCTDAGKPRTAQTLKFSGWDALRAGEGKGFDLWSALAWPRDGAAPVRGRGRKRQRPLPLLGKRSHGSTEQQALLPTRYR